jgi:hypothetical protein
VKLDVIEIGLPADIPGAFEAAKRGRATALIVLPSPMFYGERRRLAELAARHRLPAIYEVKAYVDASGLASYGPNFSDMYRRAATYVDKILKGAEPADVSGNAFVLDDEEYGVCAVEPVPNDALGSYQDALTKAVQRWVGADGGKALSAVAKEVSLMRR